MHGSRKTIVGVVGGSSPPQGLPIDWERTLQLARDVGRAIAERGAVVLTGAEPGARDRSPLQIGMVHRNAMRGAVDAGGVAIGVLPGCGAPVVRWHDGVLRIETVLTSHERNLINGVTPDVLIALAGGPGTVSEVLIARSRQRPVICLDSLRVLRAQDRGQVRAILEEASSRNRLDVDAVLDQELTGAEFRGATESVAAALGGAGPLSGETNYPGGLVGAPAKARFEQSFRNRGGAG